MSTLETLIAARKLIANKADWCQHDMSIIEGNRIKRCMVDAWCTAAGNRGSSPPYEIFMSANPSIQYGNLGRFNDTHTHKEVLAAFDAAIEKARA